MICLVGCGAIGRAHAERLRGRARLRFASRRARSAEALDQRVGGDGAYGSFEQAIADPSVEGVILATPPNVHADQIVLALEAGKAVLVEKPMCVSPIEIEAIASAPTDRLMVAENYDYKPSLSALLDWIDSGLIGRVQRVVLGKRTRQIAEDWRSGYGALIEGGIHFVALLTSLVRSEPATVAASFAGHVPGEPERNARVLVSFKNGTESDLAYAWDVPSVTKGIFQHSRIEGSEGVITFETNGVYVLLCGRRRRLVFPGFGDLMGYRAMMDDFLAVLGGGHPRSGFVKARVDLDIVFQAYAQAGLEPTGR